MTHEDETLKGNVDRDSSQELRESLEIMGKKGLTKARATAIKDLVEAVIAHPSAQKTRERSVYSTYPPMELTIPEAGVTIRAEAFDQAQYTSNPQYTVTITGLTPESTSVEPKELDSYGKPLEGDHSLRDMQTVVEDIVAMQTMQEHLSSGVTSSASQAPQI